MQLVEGALSVVCAQQHRADDTEPPGRALRWDVGIMSIIMSIICRLIMGLLGEW